MLYKTLIYSIVTLIWAAFAAFLMFRLPSCDKIPSSAKMFVVILLLINMIGAILDVYDVSTKESIMMNSRGTRAPYTFTGTPSKYIKQIDRIKSYMIVHQWLRLFALILYIFLYYILLNVLRQCGTTAITVPMIWAFLVVTIIQVIVGVYINLYVNGKVLCKI